MKSIFGTSVYALVVDTFHDNLYAGGFIDTAGNTAVQNLALWDGASWYALENSPENNVAALVMKHDTLIYGTGLSTVEQIGMYVDTQFVGYLPKLGGILYCLYVFKDTLYAGGEFNGGIKYWDGSDWKKVGGGVSGFLYQVHAIGEYNGELIVGGLFSDAGGLPVNNIAAWNGSEWHALGEGITSDNSYVYAVQEYDGELYVGGNFEEAGDLFTGSIAKWNGVVWDTVKISDIGTGCGQVYDLASDGFFLYVTGTILSDVGCMGDRVAMFDGSNWYNLYYSDSNYGFAVVTYNDKIIVGGDVKYGYNSDTINYIAQFLGYPTLASENEKENSFQLYPNPASDLLIVRIPDIESRITILNLLGKAMMELKLYKRESTIDVSLLPKGIYFVLSNEKFVAPFVKQ